MRVLFITSRPFWPPRKGEQARLVGLLTHLPREFTVATLAFVPPGTKAIPAPLPFPQGFLPLTVWSAAKSCFTHPRWPTQVAIHYRKSIIPSVRQTLAQFRPDAVVFMLSRTAWLLHHIDDVPCLVDFVDSLSLNMRHRAIAAPLAAAFWLWESFRCARWDRQVLQRATLGTVVSERDRQAIVGDSPEFAGKVVLLPFGVKPKGKVPTRPAGPPVLLLSGNLGYYPTVGGALWFANWVWPRVKKLYPKARLVIAGARPGKKILRLAVQGIEVIPDPEDLAPFREQATLAIAPLLPGSGTPIKILEAMASGVPVVASPAAVAGLDGLPPEAISVAAGVEQWLAAIAQLLDNPQRAARQAEAAFNWVREHHELTRVALTFADLLRRTAFA